MLFNMKTNDRRILIIDDERPILVTLEALLARRGYQVDTAPTASQGLNLLKSKSPALVLLDLQLPDAEGLEMLDRIKTELPEIQVIILTAHDSLINAMAPSEANVLIVGESGVGKEVIANVIHARSRRAGKIMVKLNCAAFPQTLIEGELFGYVKGAFTGAMNDFPGMIAAANGGTLFLDEISDMPADLQTRFLRVLQEHEYRPLGSMRTMKADFRVIASTNQPIAQALSENRLRSDLYYRLNTFQIEVPPLRERKQDIPPLIALFLRQFSQQLNKPEPAIAPDAFQKLLDYAWPGNVRELQNAIEYSVVLARQGLIGVKELPTEVELPAVLQQAERGGRPRTG